MVEVISGANNIIAYSMVDQPTYSKYFTLSEDEFNQYFALHEDVEILVGQEWELLDRGITATVLAIEGNAVVYLCNYGESEASITAFRAVCRLIRGEQNENT